MAKDPFSYDDAAKPAANGYSYEDAGAEPSKRSALAVANDTVIEAANAAAGGVSAAANFVKPGNAVSKFIDDKIIKAGEESQSDVVKASKKKFRDDVEGADGVGDELAAVGGYVLENPLLSAAQAAGSFVGPGAAIKGAGAAARAVGAGAKAVERAGLAGGATAGAAMAGGDAAGTAYDLASKAGATEEQATAAGRQASVIPALVGGAGSLVGAERLVAGAKGFGGNALARAGKTAAVEAAQEGFEEGITQYEGQRAAVPFDPTIDPTKGVTAAAGMGAALGGITGGGVSLLTGGHGGAGAPAPAAAPLLLTNQPDPLIAFPDGTVGRQSEIDAYLVSLPEEQRTAERARMMGLAPEAVAPPPAPYTAGAEDARRSAITRLNELNQQERGEPSVAQVAPPDSAAVLAQQRAAEEAARQADLDASRAVTGPDDEILQSIGAADAAPMLPSQRMGLDPAAGPLSSAAVVAVDSGASQQLAAQAALQQAAEKAKEQGGTEQVGPDFSAERPAREQLVEAHAADLQERLDFLQQQGRTTGWDPRLIAERNRVQGELDALGPAVAAPEPAPVDVQEGLARARARRGATAAPAQAQAGLGTVAPDAVAARPSAWRTNALQARKVAKSLGIDAGGLRTPQIVAAIDSRDAQVQTQPQGGEDVAAARGVRMADDGARSPADAAPDTAGRPTRDTQPDGAAAARGADTGGAVSPVLEAVPDAARTGEREPALSGGGQPVRESLKGELGGGVGTFEQKLDARLVDVKDQLAQGRSVAPALRKTNGIDLGQLEAEVSRLESRRAEAKALDEAAVRDEARRGLLQSARQELDASALTPEQRAGAVQRAADTGNAVDASQTVMDAVDQAAHEAATSPLNDTPEPTQAQKEAGNYKLGHLSGADVQGLRLSIENPQGSTRSGTSPDGTEWSNTMAAHYGYVKGTEAADGDHVDVFVGPHAATAPTVYVVDQVNADGTYDEAKALFGFNSEAEAVAAYKGSYDADWKVGPVTAMSVDEFKAGLAAGRFKKPLSPSLQPIAKPARGVLAKMQKAKVQRETKAARAAREAEEARAAYFTPGNVVRGYGGFDRVISYQPADSEGRWSVTVQEVRKAGPATFEDMPDADPRTHSTQPEARAMKTGPAGRVAVPAAAAPASRPVHNGESFGELYHGTPLPFERFDADRLGKMGSGEDHQGRAVYLTSDRTGYARFFARNAVAKRANEDTSLSEEQREALYDSDGVVLRVRLSPAARIYDMRVGVHPAEMQRLFDAANSDKAAGEEFRKRLMDMGYDGVAFNEPVAPEGWQTDPNATTVAVYRPELAQVQGSEAPTRPTQSDAPPASAETVPRDDRIVDFGEKIGGARKDRAEKNGTRASAAPKDDRPAWARRFEVSQIAKSRNAAEEGRWVIRDKRSLDFMKQPRQVGRGNFATREEAEAGIPLAAVSLKHRAVPMRDGTFEIWRDVTDRKRVKVVEQAFESREAGLRFMAENAQAIIETNTTFGEADLPRPASEQRVGVERRTGDVKDGDFGGTFGFRGVEFGNWNNQADRQQLLNDAYDGLLDLADVMGIPPRAISLDGELALAFGARGSGLSGARAHYEPAKAVINLTKMNGAGSLAHEWFHAMDHYFGRQDGKSSAEWVTDKDGTRSLQVGPAFEGEAASGGLRGDRSGVRAEVREAYDALMRTIAKKAEHFVEDTANADRFVARAREGVQQRLADIRTSLAQALDARYYKRNNKPATAEQLAEFDTVAQQILDGVALDLRLGEKAAKFRGVLAGVRWTNDALEKVSAIMKAARGRNGFGSDGSGPLDKLRSDMQLYSARLKMLSEAQQGSEKTRMVPTQFVMDAKELDQGRGTDYWTTPHEMAARAFQGYVEDKIAERGGASPFLNFGPENVAIPTPWGFKRPFPHGAERVAINKALDRLVEVIQTREGDGGNVALFRRSDDGLAGLTPAVANAMRALSQPSYSPEARMQAVTGVQKTVDAIRAAWSNGPDVVVAFDMGDPVVPAAARRADLKQRSGGARGAPEGFYYRGKAYLMASRLVSAQDAARVLFHEVMGHHGLRGHFGKQLDGVLNQLATMRRAEVDAKIKEYGLRGVNKLDRRAAAEEVLAEMAQRTPELHFVRRAVAAIRAWLREHVPGFRGLRLTDDEIIRNFILPARQFVERGTGATAPDAVPSFSRAEDAAAPQREASTFTEARAAAKAFQGTPLLNTETGMQAVVSRNSLDKMLSAKAVGKSASPAAHSLAVANLDALFERAVLGWSKPDREGDSNINAVHRFFVPMTRNGRELLVKLTVKETAIERDPNPLYTVEAVDFNEKSPAAQWVAASADADGINLTSIRSAGEVLSLAEQIERGNAASGDADDADIMFSRSKVAGYARTATAELNKTFSAPGTLSWWHKTVGTMYNLAERSPAFKPVFEAAQGFVDDVSFFANDAAELAPKLLPKLETWRDIKKSPVAAADNKAVAKPVFEGTLSWARDEQGQPVPVQSLIDAAAGLTAEQKAQRLLRNGHLDERMLKAWQGMPLESYEKAVGTRFESRMLQPGVVWSDAELRSMFNLNDGQVELYREFRDATDRSLDTMARADMLRFAGDDTKGLRGIVMDAPDAQTAAVLIRDHLVQLAGDQPDRATLLLNTANGIIDRADKVRDLQARGYAPLSRFGRFTVDAVDAAGERQYFGLFETAREANIMAARMREEFGEAGVSQGTLSEEAFKMFAGVTPETLELFGNALGLDSTGDSAQDKAFQDYLRLTKTNRSAMRRLIHRKGIAGFSEDVGRVLATFVYSNARQTAAGLHMGDLGEAVTAIPKAQGELKDAAVRLAEYVKNPQEEAQAVRGLLFAQYLGGSIASALVNALQPVQVTFPWLSQYGGAKAAAAQIGRAAKDLAARGKNYEPDLAAALKRAEAEGVVAPQEVHQLMAQARGAGSLRSGDGTRAGDLRALGQNALSRVSLAWGKVFGAAEQLNRRITFIAAYRTAKAQGIADPAGFARQAITETQFLYSKANKMEWGRGAVGGTLMTFKTYSVAYLELLHRMYTQGGPEGKRAALLALGMLMLMGGAGGLPFAEDLEDAADGLAQMMGYNFSSKKARQEFLESMLPRGIAQFIDEGVSGLPGAPLDVSGRLGMGNLIPGTGLLQQKTSHTRDVLEIAGPAGDFASRIFSGGLKVATGNVGAGLMEVSPAAVRNAAKGVDMAATGMYRDAKGYKVLDTNTLEAALKSIGFQPNSVATIQEANGINQGAKAFYNLRAQEIRALWAQGIFEETPRKCRRPANRWRRGAGGILTNRC